MMKHGRRRNCRRGARKVRLVHTGCLIKLTLEVLIMSRDQHGKQGRGELIAFGMALYRGIVAIALGIVLIFDPTRSQPLLVNLMGFFWLSTGFALIRRPGPERVLGKRMSWVVGLVGVLTGLLVVSRKVTQRWVPEIAVIELGGTVILLTGLLHMISPFRHRGAIRRRRLILHFLLGLLEFVFGLMLLLSPLEYGPVIYWTATIWGLIFGTLVIGDALSQRFGKPKEAIAPAQPDSPTSVPETNEG
jgi:uncharacterized membrane protein HdeD (DUF308 family)